MLRRASMHSKKKKFKAICLLFLTILSHVVTALDLVQPILLQPVDTNDVIKLTGIDTEPDATFEKVHAVGTVYD